MGVGEASQIGPMKVAGMAGSHLGGGLIGKMYVSLGTCFALLHTLQHHLSKQFLGVMGGILHQALVKKRKRRMRVHQVGDWATRFDLQGLCLAAVVSSSVQANTLTIQGGAEAELGERTRNTREIRRERVEPVRKKEKEREKRFFLHVWQTLCVVRATVTSWGHCTLTGSSSSSSRSASTGLNDEELNAKALAEFPEGIC